VPCFPEHSYQPLSKFTWPGFYLLKTFSAPLLQMIAWGHKLYPSGKISI
jgi:poly(A) polymerase Pap1